MRERGIQTLYYFQVDNPLVQIADPAFLGLHRQAEAEMSFKVVERLSPDEKLGVVVLVDGRPQVIEYSDLPPELAGLREPDGRLSLWAGSIAIHVLDARSSSGSSASNTCRSIAQSRRFPTWMRRDRRSSRRSRTA